MQIALCLLFALLSSAHGQGCSQQSLTNAQRVALVMQDNDPGKDGITTADVLKDVGENYDTNKDSIWTEEECVIRFACRYGVTQYLANYICADVLAGAASVPFSYFDIPPFNIPGGLPYAVFQGVQEKRLSDFASRQCVDRYLTVAEKVDLDLKNNDHNNNSLLEGSDVEYDLVHRYDTDKDGNTTLREFVMGWVCLYGDDGYFARYFWNEANPGIATIPNNQFAGIAPVDLEAVRVQNTKRYNDYAMAHPNHNCVGQGHGHGPIIG